MKDKKRIIQDSTEMIEILTDTTQLDKDIENLNDEMLVISELVNKLIKDNSKSNMNHEEYDKKYIELTKRYEQTKQKQDDFNRARENKKVKALNLKSFLSNLKRVDDKLSEWNESVWMLLVRSAIVHRDESITFKLNNEKEIRIR